MNFGFSETDIDGYGMIISEAVCKYKQELFLGDEIIVKCSVSILKSKIFTMDYQIEKKDKVCALGSTTNLCYDYQKKKIAILPQKFVAMIKAYEEID